MIFLAWQRFCFSQLSLILHALYILTFSLFRILYSTVFGTGILKNEYTSFASLYGTVGTILDS